MHKHLWISTALVSAALSLAYGRHARAQILPPTNECPVSGISGEIITCTGDVSPGVKVVNGAGSYTTLYVNSVDADITPAITVDGISFTSDGDIAIYSDTGPYKITTDDAHGIYAYSSDENGAGEGNAQSGAIIISHTGDISSYKEGIFAKTYAQYDYDGDTADATAGAITVTSTGDIATTGNNADGIYAYSYGKVDFDGDATSGAVRVTSTGDISTTGAFSHGIYAHSKALVDGSGIATAGIAYVKSTGDIETNDYAGIYAESYAYVGGDGTATAGDVTVKSYGIIDAEDDGIHAYSGAYVYHDGKAYAGAVEVINNRDSIGSITSGGRGIYAYSYAYVDVVDEDGNYARADKVTVESAGKITSVDEGIYAYSYAHVAGDGDATAGDVKVTSTGDIGTTDSYAEGIYAKSYAYVDGDGTAEAGYVTVTSTGNITTTGTTSDGIYAKSYADIGADGGVDSTATAGKVTVVNVGYIDARDDGIFAYSEANVRDNGNAYAGAVLVTSSGNDSGHIKSSNHGIYAKSAAGVSGDGNAESGYVTVISTGDIESNDYAGIYAKSNADVGGDGTADAGDVTVKSYGTIDADDYGIFALSEANVHYDGKAYAGAVEVINNRDTEGYIKSGDFGIYAESFAFVGVDDEDGNYAKADRVTVESEGDITSANDGIHAHSYADVDADGDATAGYMKVTNTGNIGTTSIRAEGIFAHSHAEVGGDGDATTGYVKVTSTGDIGTKGLFAAGIYAKSDADVDGDGNATAGAITVTSTGDITTANKDSIGISASSLAEVGGDGDATAGDVKVTSIGNVTSDNRHGIYAVSLATVSGTGTEISGDVTVIHGSADDPGGTIKTTGANGDGIYAFAGNGDSSAAEGGSVFVTAYGAIEAGRHGIYAVSTGFGNVTITTFGDVKGGTTGIYAITETGDAFITIASHITGDSGTAVDLIKVGVVDGESYGYGTSRVELQPGFAFTGRVDARNNGQDPASGNRLVFGGPAGEAEFDLSQLSDHDGIDEAGEVFFGFDNVFLKEDDSNFIFIKANPMGAEFDEAEVTGGLAILDSTAYLRMADNASPFTVSGGGFGAQDDGGKILGDVELGAGGAIVLSNSGPFDSVAGLDGADDVLAIDGNFHSDGGKIYLDTYLDDGSSQQTDLLVVYGDTYGTAYVFITNTGGPGGETGDGPTDGIMVVDVDGASNGEFLLGAQLLDGIYQYALVKADGQDWYLQSSELLGDQGVLLPVMPWSLRNFGHQLAGSLDQRSGGRIGWPTRRGTSYGADLAPDAAEAAPVPAARGQNFFGSLWARLIGSWSQASGSPDDGLNDASYDEQLQAVQAGLDLLAAEAAGGLWTASVFGHYGTIDTDATNDTGGYSAGSVDTTGYGGGLALNYAGAGGFYVDGVASFTQFDLDTRTGEGVAGSTSAHSLVLSGEIGQEIALSPAFSVTPQAQLVWQKIDIDEFNDDAGVSASFSNSDSLQGRLGGKFAFHVDANTQLYAKAGLLHEFLDDPVATAEGTPLSLALGKTGYELGGGAQWASADGTMALWAQGDYSAALDGGDYSAWQATAGVSYRF